MTLVAASASTAGAEPEWGRTAFGARAVLALVTVIYAFTRFGPREGVLALVAASAVVLLDVIQAFGLHRAPFAGAQRAGLIAAQALIICALFFAPAPFGYGSAVPPPVMLESPLFMLLLCFLASHVSAARPGLVWQAGAAILVVWGGALAWTLALPDTVTRASLHPERFKAIADLLSAVNSPHYFNLDLWKADVQSGAAVVLILGLAAYRMRRLARQSAAREAGRDALAAYFSPQVVETVLASSRAGFQPRERQVAVLDCDLVGFTRLAESLSPERTAEVLGLYRSVVEAAAFAEDGAILSWTGDGAAAVFGLTGAGETAASRALAAARRLQAAWPAAAQALLGGAPLDLALGIDFGAGMLGIVGEGGAVSLLMVGSPVQGASKMQAATRSAGGQLLVSDAAHSAIVVVDPASARTLSPCAVDGAQAWLG